MKKFLYNFLPLGALLIISILSHRTWLDPNAILTNGDVWYLYREGMATFNSGTWTSLLSTGELNISYNLYLLGLVFQAVAKLGFDYQIANQIVYFFPVIFIAPIAIYSYLKLMTEDREASFVGSLVFLFTTFFIMMQNGGLLFAVAYLLLPIQFYFLEKYLRQQKKLDGLYFVLTMSIAIFYELRVVYISLFIITAYIFFFFITKERKKFFSAFFRFIIRSLPFVVLLLAINAYIYLPLLLSTIKESAAGIGARSLFGVNFFTIRESFVLMHPFWTGKVPTEFIPQPIPFYFWIFPLFAFGSLFFAKKEKNIVFFAAVALLMVFLGKSAAAPLGGIYTWLYYNFPGFGFFREPSKFWLMLCFSYSILIAFSVKYYLLAIDALRKKGSLIYLFCSLPVLCLVVVVFIVAKPTFTNEIGPLFQPLAVTSEHYAVKDFINNQQQFFRTYYIPGRYRMAFWSQNHPMLGLNEVPLQFQTLDPHILSLLSVKYVIIPPDITNDVYRIWGSKKVYEEQAANATGLKKLDNPSFGGFTVYENSLPAKDRIYSPSALVYIVGNNSDLLSLLPIISTKEPAYYFNTEEMLESEPYNASSEVLLSSSCIRCEGVNNNGGLVFPFANILPQSFFYPFILAREQKNLLVTADPYAKLQLAVFYGVKRMAELQKIDDGNYPSQFAIPVLKEQKKLLDYTQDNLKNTINSLSNDALLYLYDYLNAQVQIGQTFLTKKYLNAEGRGLLENNYQEVNNLEHLVYNRVWVSDNTSQRYFLSTKKAGNYDLFLQSSSLEKAVTIDGAEVVLSKSDKSGWVSLQNYTLSAGVHKIAAGKPESLISSYPQTTEVPAGIETKEIGIPVDNIEENTSYSLSFTYRTSPHIQVRSFLLRDTDFSQEGIQVRTGDRYLFSDNNWYSVSTPPFQSRFGERKAVLKFVISKPQDVTATFDLQNLQLKKVNPPLVVAKYMKPVAGDIFKSQPRLSYQWTDPTKYIVHVTDAKDPFYLIFNDSYHSSWTASYSSNQMLTSHIPINAYANAWYVDKKGTYDIVLNFSPQKIFVISLIFSGIAFAVGMLWLLFLKLKK